MEYKLLNLSGILIPISINIDLIEPTIDIEIMIRPICMFIMVHITKQILVNKIAKC